MNNQYDLPLVLINSFPKSGTYIVANTLNFLGFKYKEPFLARNLRNHFYNLRYWRHPETCMVGVGQPNTIKLETLCRLLRTTQPGYYRLGHIPYQNNEVQMSPTPNQPKVDDSPCPTILPFFHIPREVSGE